MPRFEQDLQPEYPKFVARCSCEWSASDYGEQSRDVITSLGAVHERKDPKCDVTVLRVSDDGSEEVVR